MHLKIWITCFTGMIVTIPTNGQIKIWRGNTNFHNPNNWSPAHIPCSASRVIFPASYQKLVVMLSPVTTTIREMILPSNGEIILPSSGALVFESMHSKSRNCKNEDVTYVGRKLSSWMDPSSWGTKDNNTSDIQISAIPHAEQIPCGHDKVIFPSGSSFRLLLPEVEVSIGSLEIQGRSLTTDTWRQLAESEVGRQQFIGDPATITVFSNDGEDHPCRNPTGCYCLTYGPKTMESVCSYAGGSRCGIALCLKPVHPIGHCCDICGAKILVEYNPLNFQLSSLQNHVKRFTSSSVLGHVGKVSSIQNKVQIVYVDADVYDGKSVEAAERLVKVLKNDMSLGLIDISLSASGEAIDLSEVDILKSPVKITGFIFGGLVLIAIAVLLFLAYKDERYIGGQAPSFMFSRFENLSRRSEGPVIRVWGDDVAEEANEEEQKDGSKWVTMESVLPQSMPQAFDNPMYDKPGMSRDINESEAIVSSGIIKGMKKSGGTSQSVTLENPVYSALKESVEEEEKSMGKEKARSDEKAREEETEEWKLSLPPTIMKRKAKAPKPPKKGKVKKEILSEEDTDSGDDSETLTIIEDLDP